MSEWIVIKKYKTDPMTGEELMESEERFDLLSAYQQLSAVENRLLILEEFVVQHRKAHHEQDKAG